MIRKPKKPTYRVCPRCFQWLEIVDGELAEVLLLGRPIMLADVPDDWTPLTEFEHDCKPKERRQ